MTITLRDYQRDAVSSIELAWAEGINRPAVVLPTGAGKTVCFSALIANHVDRLRKDGKRVLVLAHREELLEQAEAKIKAMIPGAWTAIVKGSRGQKTHEFADVVIASVQTLARPKRREAVGRIGMVIVDECHRAASKGYLDVLNHYGCMDERQTPTVGFTATLTRMNGGLPDVWQSVAYQKKIHWMIKEGHLVPPVAKSIDIPGLNLASTRVTAGDLNTGDLANALEESAAFDVIADTWLATASERPTIAFMPDVRTTEALTAAFQARGVAAETVVGATPSMDRKATYEKLSAGTTRVLVSCMTLTEGFDSPSVSCAIIGRPTLNPGLYIQMVGRALRLYPGKTDALILDMAGASNRHSLAGVNDLESDCEARCDCDCLSCGCSDRCKCGIRQCGCRCIEQHESPSKACRDAGDGCGCGCEGDPYETGDAHCICNLNDDCECRGEGPVRETGEVSADVLRNLVDVDILGTELAASRYVWLSTAAGIRYLTVGQDSHLFLLPAPDGSGYFQGRINSTAPKAPVTRLDNGAVSADVARKGLEDIAAASGYTYNNKSASWRRSAASGAQTSLMRRLGVVFPEGVKKGEASDLLSNHKVSAAIDPRFGRYVVRDGAGS